MTADPLYGASSEWDEDGFHLRLAAEESDPHVVVRDLTIMRELLAAVEPLRDHVAEADRQKADYDRATPEERDRVLGRADPEPNPAEDARVAADHARKAEKENQQ